jgi:hypothetical protein
MFEITQNDKKMPKKCQFCAQKLQKKKKSNNIIEHTERCVHRRKKSQIAHLQFQNNTKSAEITKK